MFDVKNVLLVHMKNRSLRTYIKYHNCEVYMNGNVVMVL